MTLLKLLVTELSSSSCLEIPELEKVVSSSAMNVLSAVELVGENSCEALENKGHYEKS